MISIIISSYRENLLNDLTKNLHEKTTVPFEIIPITNHNEMSLTQAYNLGAKRAKYEYLCFMHEDIKIHTSGWDEKVINIHQSKPNAGVIGVAGSKIKPHLPTGWPTFNEDLDFVYIMQHYFNKPYLLEWKPENGIAKVKVLDGVFLFTHKSVWKAFPFNEKIEGYHFYDIDFSLHISQSFQNYMTSEVLIEHYSDKGYDNSWFVSTFLYHKKNKGEPLFDTIYDSTAIQKGWYNFLHLAHPSTRFINRLKFIKMMGVSSGSFRSAIKFLALDRVPKKISRLLRSGI